jgi:hypothetical protein
MCGRRVDFKHLRDGRDGHLALVKMTHRSLWAIRYQNPGLGTGKDMLDGHDQTILDLPVEVVAVGSLTLSKHGTY